MKQVGFGLGKRGKRLNKPLHSSKQTIDQDAYDIEIFEEIYDNSQSMRKNMLEGTEDYAPFRELLQDTFSSLYKYNPDLLKDFEINQDFLLNKAIMGEAMKAPKYKELRALTKVDQINSAIGTEIMSEKLKELLKQAKEQRAALEALKQAIKDAKEAEDGEEAEGVEGDDGKDGPGKPPDPDLTLKEAKKRLEEARKDFEKSVDKKEFKRSVHSSIGNAQEETGEVSDMIQAWGLNSDGTYSNSGYKEKMALLDRLRNNSKLQDIAKKAGKYRALAMQRQQQKVIKGNNEIYNVTKGRDLGNILPSELFNLTEEITEPLFYKKYMESDLLQYEKRDKAKEVKGPIVCAMDESMSMHGSPEIWAKAVALGLLEIAINQKRDFAAIHFDAEHDPKKLKVDYFLKEEGQNIEKLIEFAEYFAGGGTDFETPLTLSRQIIDDHEKFTKADIVFITDGQCAIGDKFKEDFNKWRKENKVTIYSILIDTSWGSTSTLEEFTDKENIMRLADLAERKQDDAAITLFDMV